MELPEEMKNVLANFDVPKKIRVIADKYHLHVDQSGYFSNEIYIVLLGLSDGTEFVKDITTNLGLSRTTAVDITKFTNEEIFIPIRKKILEMSASDKKDSLSKSQPIQKSNEEISTYKKINKADILAEIENPVPAVHPISIADQTISGPARPREIINVPQDTKKASTGSSENENNADTVASEFITGKLTETVSLPSQRVNVEPRTYKADPYREPTN